MNIVQSIEILTALSFLITGLSHLFQPKIWVSFFISIRENGKIAGFINSFIQLPLGLLIVSFHNIWTVPEILVTLIGWSLTLKGTLYFLLPKIAEKSFARVSFERAWEFRLAGVFSIILSAAIFWIVF